MSWKDIFNTNHKHWGLDLAVAAAREAMYPMICWNGRIYAIRGDGTINLQNSLCLAEDIK